MAPLCSAPLRATGKAYRVHFGALAWPRNERQVALDRSHVQLLEVDLALPPDWTANVSGLTPSGFAAEPSELLDCDAPDEHIEGHSSNLVRVLKDSREASSRDRSAESPSSWSSRNERLGADALGTCNNQ